MNSYQDAIVNEFKRRKLKNPSYSVRAMSKSFGLAATHLGLVISGKRNISRIVADKIVQKISLSDRERELFLALVDAEVGRSQNEVNSALDKVAKINSWNSFSTMDESELELITSWKNIILFTLFDLDSFQPSISWMSEMTGLSEVFISTSLDKMEKLGLLVRSETKWELSKKNLTSPNIKSDSIKRFHLQALENAGTALGTQELGQRDFSAVVLPFDPSRIEEAKERIQEFRRSFYKEFCSGSDKTDVYSFSMQFFSATKSTKANK